MSATRSARVASVPSRNIGIARSNRPVRSPCSYFHQRAPLPADGYLARCSSKARDDALGRPAVWTTVSPFDGFAARTAPPHFRTNGCISVFIGRTVSNYRRVVAPRFQREWPVLLREKLRSFVGILLLAMICEGGVRADETAVKQDPASKAEGPPPGACLPIGVTASGEVVFPLLCKDFLDRTKGQSASQSTDEQRQSTEKPASLDHNSDLESEVVQKPLTEKTPEAVQVEPNSVDTVASIQPPFSSKLRTHEKLHRRPLRRVSGSSDCRRYRTFDQDSQTYRDYSGRRRVCR